MFFSLQGIPGVPGKRGKMGRPVKFFLIYYADLVEWKWKQDIWLLAGSFHIFKQTFPYLSSQAGRKPKTEILLSSFLPCSAQFTGIITLLRFSSATSSLLSCLWPITSLDARFNTQPWLQCPRCLYWLCSISCFALPPVLSHLPLLAVTLSNPCPILVCVMQVWVCIETFLFLVVQ